MSLIKWSTILENTKAKFLWTNNSLKNKKEAHLVEKIYGNKRWEILSRILPNKEPSPGPDQETTKIL